MNDTIGVANNAEIRSVFATYQIMLGRQFHITDRVDRNAVVNNHVCLIVNKEEPAEPLFPEWEAIKVEEFKLIIHSPDCAQLLMDSEELFDGNLNPALRRFRSARVTMTRASDDEKSGGKKNKKFAETEERKIRHAILNQVMGNVGDKISDAKMIAALTKAELEALKEFEITLAQRLVTAEKDIEGLSTLSKEQLDDKIVDEIIETIMKLYRSGAYTSIEFTTGGIVAITNHIWIIHLKQYYYMGTYKIKVPYSGTGVQIDLVLRPPNVKVDTSQYQHPHVSGTQPCLGNIGSAVPQFLKKGAYGALLSLLVEYLESYNSGNPYRKLDEYWIPYPKDAYEPRKPPKVEEAKPKTK